MQVLAYQDQFCVMTMFKVLLSNCIALPYINTTLHVATQQVQLDL